MFVLKVEGSVIIYLQYKEYAAEYFPIVQDRSKATCAAKN